MQADRFFMTAVPTRVRDNADGYLALRGVLWFRVRGEGDWAVRLGDMLRPVERGRPERADLKLFFSREAFQGWMDGSLDPAKLGPADLVVQGDSGLFSRFSRFLSPPTSPLGVRFGGF